MTLAELNVLQTLLAHHHSLGALHLVSTGVLAVPDFCCLGLHCITLHDMTCCSLHFAALAVAQHVQTKKR